MRRAFVPWWHKKLATKTPGHQAHKTNPDMLLLIKSLYDTTCVELTLN